MSLVQVSRGGGDEIKRKSFLLCNWRKKRKVLEPLAKLGYEANRLQLEQRQ